MDSLFGSLKGFFKQPGVVIDNTAFQLHYRVTFVILIAFSLMIISKQYLGDPIDCIPVGNIPSTFLDNHCWWFSYWGLEPEEIGPGEETPNQKRVYHVYYQWVCFVFFVQALFFYVPRYLWKNFGGGGRVQQLVKDLTSPIIDDNKRQRIGLVAHYLKTYNRQHNSYFFFFALCEILNLLNVILQMMIMDRFLGGAFTTYGWNVFTFIELFFTAQSNPVFPTLPRVFNCSLTLSGRSGRPVVRITRCYLPANIMVEKLYMFLFIWLIFLGLISFVAIVYRIATLFSCVRHSIMKWNCIFNEIELQLVIKNMSAGSWFILNNLVCNIDTFDAFSLLSALKNDTIISTQGLPSITPPDTNEKSELDIVIQIDKKII